MARSILEAAVLANHTAVMQANDRLTAALAEHSLTHATAQALWAIDPDEAPPPMKTIARRVFCNAPNLSFVMKQLTERGLVERTVDPHDRRSRVVNLTDDGRRVREAVIEAALGTSPLARLEPDELRELAALLNKALQSTSEPDGA
ncbi:MarR family winged helix-turn-helix transcriptional regulator [Streptomyces sp. NPDC054796]